MSNLIKKISRFFLVFIFSLSLVSINEELAHAKTEKGQFQIGTGFGLFVGSRDLDPSFDFDVEPEYFFTNNMSVAGRFDGVVGGTDGVHFSGRFRYYFNFTNHERFNVYAGAGMGFMVNFNRANYGDIALPVGGFQYDLTHHIKLGSEVSFNLVFNGDGVGFATRLMPVQFKWAF